MHELIAEEINSVSGGRTEKCGVKREYDLVPCAQSGYGDILNDASNMFGTFGSWIGRSAYDLTH